ncbi:MAG: OsmC family protein [Candidatus Dormibacteraeota bacterium]|nr:OsmC family protein [Candidatus Dormibacteraeota bacterium]
MGGALEARGIDAGEGRLTCEAEGEVVVEDKVLVMKRIRVRYDLKGCPEGKREAAERAHAHHASRCPVARSISGSIEIVTGIEYSD